MRNTIIVNPAPHGIGPILHTAQLALSLYRLLQKEGQSCRILLPEPKNPKVKSILLNDFFRDAAKDAWLAPEYGRILEMLGYNTPDYRDRLKIISEQRCTHEKKLVSALEKGMRAYNLANSGKSEVMHPCDMLCEVAHNSLVRTTIDGSYPIYATSIGLLSGILEHIAEINPLYNSPEMHKLLQSCICEAKEVESSADVMFVAEPSAMSYLGKPSGKNIAEMPPYMAEFSRSTECMEQGIYINISGIGVVQERIISLAESFADAGYLVYYPESYGRTIKGGKKISAVSDGKSIFSNPAIIACAGRLGWGSVWEAAMNGKPFITYAYGWEEDPEMHHNAKTLAKLGLGMTANPGEDIKCVMKEALALKPGISRYASSLMKKYGTLNGMEYAAREISRRLAANR